MKKNKRSIQVKTGINRWHRVTAAMLLCGLTSVPLHAQNAANQAPAPAQAPAGTPEGVPANAPSPASNQANLNFVGADIESVIKAIGHYTNTTFLIDPRVKGTITLVSEKPLTKNQAFQLLTSTLRMHGYAVVMSDGFAKVVPEADAKLQASPIQAERVRGDQVVTQVFRLRHESAAGLVPVLRPLISPNNTINAYPGNNTLVITDYADNLRRLERIIASMDRPMDGEIEIIPVEHAIAADLVGILSRLLAESPAVTTPTRGNAAAQQAANTGGGASDVMVDPRTNSIIVRGATQSYITRVRSLVERLDQPTSKPGNVHVVHLRNAEATQLAQTLRAIVAGETATPGGGNQQAQMQQTSQQQGNNTAAGLQTSPSTSPQQQQGPLPTGGPGGYIQADPTTNTLIITASEAVYRNLRAVIEQLDSRRAQVYVESLIVEVSASRAAELGVQWAGLSGDSGSSYRIGTLTGFGSGGNNLISQAASIATTGNPVAAPGNGLNLGVFRQVGGQLTLGALARALETEDDANILSMPNLITLDNSEARIVVGENVPFITGQFTTAAGGGAGVNPFQTIERQDVGLSLRVRPQISEGGTVKMAIYQETSAVQQTTASGPITSKRSIETNVLVDDGQIIVLGGLIDDTMRDGVEKVPGLGDIPVLGHLFKYQTRTRAKRNLMVFLRPTVIRTAAHGSTVTVDRYDYIRNVGIASQARPSGLMPDMGPLLLPPMLNGRIVEPPLLQVNLNEMGAMPNEATPLPPAHGQLPHWSSPASSPSPLTVEPPPLDIRAPQ